MRRIGFLLLLLLIELCAAQLGQDTCKATTKQKCRKKGGFCQSKGYECAGPIRKGSSFCKDSETCDCCTPCARGTKPRCTKMDGTCMKKDDFCNGTEIMDKAFCKEKQCKCCFPACNCNPASCTYKNEDGRCSRHWLPDTKKVGTQECKNGCECYIPDIIVNSCTSIGDRCTGNGDYCLESPNVACKEGYTATEECWKLVMLNGSYKGTPCTCCKPRKVIDCEYPWFRVGPQCFRVVNTFEAGRTWSNVRKLCNDTVQGADLAQPTDLSALVNTPHFDKVSTYWIGGFKPGSAWSWIWINGSPVSWVAKQVQGWHEGNCLALQTIGGYPSLHGVDCETFLWYVCERY